MKTKKTRRATKIKTDTKHVKKSAASSYSGNMNDRLEKLDTIGRKELVKRAKKFSENYCVGDGTKFRLKNYKTKAGFDLGPEGKQMVSKIVQEGVGALMAVQRGL